MAQGSTQARESHGPWEVFRRLAPCSPVCTFLTSGCHPAKRVTPPAGTTALPASHSLLRSLPTGAPPPPHAARLCEVVQNVAVPRQRV